MNDDDDDDDGVQRCFPLRDDDDNDDDEEEEEEEEKKKRRRRRRRMPRWCPELLSFWCCSAKVRSLCVVFFPLLSSSLDSHHSTLTE